MAVGVPVLSFGLLIALGPHSIQKVMDKRDFDGKIHTHSTNSTKLTRLSRGEESWRALESQSEDIKKIQGAKTSIFYYYYFEIKLK